MAPTPHQQNNHVHKIFEEALQEIQQPLREDLVRIPTGIASMDFDIPRWAFDLAQQRANTSKSMWYVGISGTGPGPGDGIWITTDHAGLVRDGIPFIAWIAPEPTKCVHCGLPHAEHGNGMHPFEVSA